MDVNQFGECRSCSYKGESYMVRDNGALMRAPRPGQAPRRLDGVWTFGKSNAKVGYMELAGERVHRIVATAFHGPGPTESHVVDHIDTNRRNNRPTNLRWLTRLENVLLNDITRSKIEYLYGSIEAFLENPQRVSAHALTQNFRWMRSVNEDEAKATLERLRSFAASDRVTGGYAGHSGAGLGEWVYARLKSKQYTPVPANEKRRARHPDADTQPQRLLERPWASPVHSPIEPQEDTSTSLTVNCLQRRWKTPTEFPLAPQEIVDEPLKAYQADLLTRQIAVKNRYSEAVCEHAYFNESGDELHIITKIVNGDGLKPYGYAIITFVDDYFIHQNVTTFFTEEGANKAFALALDLPWDTSIETIDDFC